MTFRFPSSIEIKKGTNISTNSLTASFHTANSTYGDVNYDYVSGGITITNVTDDYVTVSFGLFTKF